MSCFYFFFFFFFNDTATTEIYTLSLHDALPILIRVRPQSLIFIMVRDNWKNREDLFRSEEHTSELQSHVNLVCRLLLEKKKKPRVYIIYQINYSIIILINIRRPIISSAIFVKLT